MNFNEKLENLLKIEPFMDTNGRLLKHKIKSSALGFDEVLIALLLGDDEAKEHFFRSIGGALVFDYRSFVDYIEDKNFLIDSYTKFSNKVGLTISNKHLKQLDDVVLSFPFKDCVLEGGQSKEEEKRKEIFFNETLAKDEITRLFAPKVLTNFRHYYYEDGEVKETQKVSFNRDEQGTIKDNLIIKGNNLIALHSIKNQFAGRVKLIYIDPPYNTGNDGFKYNDSFNHSTWLTFMKNRLEVARELLRDDGSIWISLDDNEVHYCKVLCDEIFGRENFVSNIIWHKKNVVQNDAKYFNQNHDHILVIAKNKEQWKPNLLSRTKEMNARYDNPDNDPRGEWTSVALQAKSGSKDNIYEVTFSNGVTWKPVEGTYPRLNKASLLKAYDENRLWFGKSGKNIPRLKKYLSEVKQGLVTNSIFPNNDSGSTQQAKEELKKVIGQNIFTTPKPEKLLQRIIHIGSDANDIVLDFFSGSGTTGAVAHKMKRQYILIEQMGYIHELPESRMKKVIEGEQGGISKAVNWQGGGAFTYFELAQYNQIFIDRLQEATSENILEIYSEITQKGFLHYDVELKHIEANFEAFKALSLDDKVELLFSMLNKNMLYKNLTELEDVNYKIDADTQSINRDFYGKR